MDEFSQRRFLSTAMVAGAAMTTTAANAADPVPEPSRAPGVGGTDPVPRGVAREAQNPDLINPPATDSGTLPNLRFSFADAQVRQSSGGWTRQVTVRELAVSKPIAGVDMRLNAGGIRELHWHKQAEWAYMLYGTARITAIDPHGRNFVDDVGVGDLWYFAGGIPHSIQGLGPDGCEFLLVFDDGDFDEDSTFLLSDWFKHTPPEVLGKNFGVQAASVRTYSRSARALHLQVSVPGPLGADKLIGAEPVPQTFSHHMLAQEPIRTKSGTVRITDSTSFPPPRTSQPRWSRWSRGACERCTGIPTPTNGNITSKARGAWGCSPRTARRAHSISSAATSATSRSRWGITSKIPDRPAAVPRDVQEQLLRRCVVQPVAGADAARTRESAPQVALGVHGRAEKDQGAGRSGVNRPRRWPPGKRLAPADGRVAAPRRPPRRLSDEGGPPAPGRRLLSSRLAHRTWSGDRRSSAKT